MAKACITYTEGVRAITPPPSTDGYHLLAVASTSRVLAHMTQRPTLREIIKPTCGRTPRPDNGRIHPIAIGQPSLVSQDALMFRVRLSMATLLPPPDDAP